MLGLRSQTTQAPPKTAEIRPLWCAPKRYKFARLQDFNDNLVDSLGLDTEKAHFITGPAGTGKTHLAVAILRCWLKAQPPRSDSRPGRPPPYEEITAAFLNVPEYLARIKASFGNDRETPSEEWIVKTYQHASLLVLDDLGAENQSDWAFSALYRLLSYRVNELMPTVVTSNMGLKEVDAFDPRIASRLSGMLVVTLGGEDLRVRCDTRGQT